MATVIKIDPWSPVGRLLIPQLTQRIEKYASEYQPEADPHEYAGTVIAKLYVNDPSLVILGIIDDDKATLVGHVVASVEGFGNRRWVYVPQIRADKDVGNARFEALNMVTAWAKSLSINQILLATNQDGKEFEKRGFKRFRTVHRISLEDNKS